MDIGSIFTKPVEPVKTMVPSRGELQSDDAKLEVYFHAVHDNYRTYLGDPISEKLKIKLYAIYKQATCGDNDTPRPFDQFRRTRWDAWRAYKGTEKAPAMRRYVTLLRQIDPELAIVEVLETPPPGFPTTSWGEPICARANCKGGCLQPLIETQKLRQGMQPGAHLPNGGHDPSAPPLEERLMEDASLQTYNGLKAWLNEEKGRLRCKFGRHIPINEGQAKPFEDFFHHCSAGGFHAYDFEQDSTLNDMVIGMLEKNYRRAYRMQLHEDDYDYEERVSHVQRCLGIQKAFYEVSRHYYTLQVPCERFDAQHCNAKRTADGGKNHTHALELVFPEPNYANYGHAAALRREVLRTGLDPTTFVVKNIDDREAQLAARIAHSHKIRFEIQEAKRRQRARAFYRPMQLERLKEHEAKHTAAQLEAAVRANNAELTVALARKGAPLEVETESGLTPLIRAVLNSDRSFMRMLVEAGAEVNAFSVHSGLSALCWACRRGDLHMIAAVLALPDVTINGEGPLGHTPLSCAAEAGQIEAAELLVNWLKKKFDNDNDAENMVQRLLNQVNKFGDSALHAAARARQLPACVHLLTLGARKLTRNKNGRDAEGDARDLGFSELADWLANTRLGFEGRAGAALVKQLEIHQSEGVPMGHLDKRKAELEAAARASAEEADAAALARAERASQLMVLCLRRNLRRGQEEQLGRRAPQTSLLGGGGKKGIGGLGAVMMASKLSKARKKGLAGSSSPSSQAAKGSGSGGVSALMMASKLHKAGQKAKTNGQSSTGGGGGTGAGALMMASKLHKAGQKVKGSSSSTDGSDNGSAASSKSGGGGGGGGAVTLDLYASEQKALEGSSSDESSSSSEEEEEEEEDNDSDNTDDDDDDDDDDDEESKAKKKQAKQEAKEEAKAAKELARDEKAKAKEAKRALKYDEFGRRKKKVKGSGSIGSGSGSSGGSSAPELTPFEKNKLAFKLLTRLAESEDPLGMNASATANSSLESVMSESSASLSPEKQQQLINDEESNHDNDENNGYPPFPLCVDLVQRDGCPPNQETPEGATPLIVAAFDGHAPAVRRLISEGASPDYMNRNGRTALMAAASGGHASVVIELVRAGARVHLVDVEGKTAGRYAAEASQEHISRFLVNIAKNGSLTSALEVFKPSASGSSGGGGASSSNLGPDLEKLLVSYGGSAGEPGGPEDGGGDSYLWRLPPEKPLIHYHHHELSLDHPSSSEGGEGRTVFPDDVSDGISGLRRPHFNLSSSTTTMAGAASPLGGLNSPNSMGFTASLDSTSSSPGMPGSVHQQQQSQPSLQLPPSQLPQHQTQAAQYQHSSSPPPGAAPRPSTGGHARSTNTSGEGPGGARAGAMTTSSASLDRSHRSGQVGSNGSMVSMSTTTSQKLAKKFANPRDAPEEVALRKEVASYGKRHVCHRPNPVEQAWLQKIADEAGAGIGANGKPKPLATEKTSKARAKVALNESTERAKAQVAALAKRVSEALENSGGHSDSSKGGIKSSSILMLGDGLEQWKDRLDEVKRQWVVHAKQPAEVVAAKRQPKLFVQPAEYDLACWLISQKDFTKAEKHLLDVVDIQTRAELRQGFDRQGRFAVGLALRGLASVAEARGQLADALGAREASLGLIASSLEPSHPEVRVAVDLVAGTHMLNRDWDLAAHLYLSVADEMRESGLEAKQAEADVMEFRASAVAQVRERRGMVWEDGHSRAAEELFRDPELARALRMGKTKGHLEALLGEPGYANDNARKVFKKHVSTLAASLSDVLGFWFAVHAFSKMNPTAEAQDEDDDDDEDAAARIAKKAAAQAAAKKKGKGGKATGGFAATCRTIYKKYIKPNSKLPMLTQGIRADAATAMNNPTSDMFATAQDMCLDTLYAAVYAGKAAWIDTEEGQYWKTTRDVGIDPKKLHLVTTIQVKVRYVLKKRQDEREWYAAEKERNQRGGGSWGGGWGGGGWGGNSGSLPRLRR